METVRRTERGWCGHFIYAKRCLFRRNTLLEYKDKKIVVSTVGNFTKEEDKITKIGLDRYYETMAFESDYNDTVFYDADVSKQVVFESKWSISKLYDSVDNEANEMHEQVLIEIEYKLRNNKI